MYNNSLTSSESNSAVSGTPGKTPTDSGEEFTLLRIVNNRSELEYFRAFLVDNFASTDDLDCWLDIEALRRLPNRLRDANVRLVVCKYFNDLYFYGPASPANRQEQDWVRVYGDFLSCPTDGRKDELTACPVLLSVLTFVVYMCQHCLVFSLL